MLIRDDLYAEIMAETCRKEAQTMQKSCQLCLKSFSRQEHIYQGIYYDTAERNPFAMAAAKASLDLIL
jgi:hypothetical protein